MAGRRYRLSDVDDDQDALEFGPAGYLPERASKRARKIVLRAPLGMQWIVSALVFGVLVLVAGLVWLGSAGPPGSPYVSAGLLPDGGPSVTAVAGQQMWLVAGAGPVLAVPATQVEVLAWCPESGRLESGDGRVWTPTGRGLGTPSLATHPVVVHDGTVYVDPTAERPGPRPATDPAPPAC